MRLEVLNVAVVVLADSHNASILHPSFLKSGIVPPDWDLAEDPISTPAFSMAKYKNGIVFSVQGNQFAVIDNEPTARFWESEIPSLAAKYLTALPHVRYTVVGTNIAGLIATEDPESLLMDRFLKAGAWSKGLKAAGVNVVYAGEHGDLKISCQPGKASRNDSAASQRGVIVNCNYQEALPTEDGTRLESACSSVMRFSQHAKDFLTALKSLIDWRNSMLETESAMRPSLFPKTSRSNDLFSRDPIFEFLPAGFSKRFTEEQLVREVSRGIAAIEVHRSQTASVCVFTVAETGMGWGSEVTMFEFGQRADSNYRVRWLSSLHDWQMILGRGITSIDATSTQAASLKPWILSSEDEKFLEEVLDPTNPKGKLKILPKGLEEIDPTAILRRMQNA